MIEIIAADSLFTREILTTAETFAEAKAMVEKMGVVFMEDDIDFVDCADAYLNDGRTISIQPIGFTVTDEKHWADGKSA